MKKTRRILLWGIMGLTVFCLTAMGVSALSNLTIPRNTTSRDQLAELDKERLAEAIHLRQTLGDVVWPGLGQMQIPIIIWNKDYSFLVGLTKRRRVGKPSRMISFWIIPIFDKRAMTRRTLLQPSVIAGRPVWRPKSETDQFLNGRFSRPSSTADRKHLPVPSIDTTQRSADQCGGS